MAGVPRAKTTAPRLPLEFVSRPALLAALDGGEQSALTLVCAPPGYGKTLLLADWLRRRGGAVRLGGPERGGRRPAAPVELGPRRSRAPARGAGDESVHGLVVPRTTVGIDFLTDLLDGARDPADAHAISFSTTPTISAAARRCTALRLLLRNRRSRVRLVLASRFDPALPVARLRMEERLCELRTAQLRFSAEETAALAGLCGLHLTDDQAALLQRPHRRLGGGDPARRAPAAGASGRRPSSSPGSPGTSDRSPTTSPGRCSRACRRPTRDLPSGGRASPTRSRPDWPRELSGRAARRGRPRRPRAQHRTRRRVRSAPDRVPHPGVDALLPGRRPVPPRPGHGGAAAPSGQPCGGRPRTAPSRRCAMPPRRPTARC